MVEKGKDVVVVMDEEVVRGLVTAEDIFFASSILAGPTNFFTREFWS